MQLAAAAGLAAVTTGCTTPGSSKQPDSGKGGGKDGGRPGEGLDMSGELELDYAILLDDDGAERRIDEKRRLRDNDRFRVQLKPGFAAHVYLLNRGTVQPHYTFLYPNPKISRENPLEAGRAVTLPGGSEWFTLDKASGVENLVLIASPVALVEFNTPERTIPRDECEARLALVERDYRPKSSRRFEDRDWVKLFAARGAKTAFVLRLPLDHR